MKFECGDLDRALATPELMPEAREHLKQCAACRREYRVWTEISTAAKELHEEWDSPGLWPRIRDALAAEPKRNQPVWWREWKTWAIAAVALIGVSVAVIRPWDFGKQQPAAKAGASPASPASFTSSDQSFLTEQALKEVERTEAAYRQSIDNLSKLAQPKLQNPVSAVAVNSREKLVMLDSAIAETRANLDQNRFNVRLQTELANLYREKQETLKELVTRDQKN
jgi:hypothetical protein